jgi:hypothetical protein
MDDRRLNILGSLTSIAGFLLSLVLLLIGHPTAAAFAVGGLALAWCTWATLSILSLQRASRLVSTPPHHVKEAPKFSLVMGEARRVDALDKKFRIPSDVLTWNAGTLLFWTDLSEEIAHAEQNRYIFSYTTDTNDASNHPDGFLLAHWGKSSQWQFRFYHDPAERKTNCISFHNAPNTLGIHMVAIRWCEREGFCDLTLDGGSHLANDIFCGVGPVGRMRVTKRSTLEVGRTTGTEVSR